MAQVDPRLGRIPDALLKDRETRIYFEELERFLTDAWVRSGGGEDLIQDVGDQQTAEDGGNRSYRKFDDEIAELAAAIDQIKRTNKNLELLLNEALEEISEVKVKSKLSNQELSELSERFIPEQRTRSRLTEQKLNELIERYEDGT